MINIQSCLWKLILLQRQIYEVLSIQPFFSLTFHTDAATLMMGMMESFKGGAH